MDTYLCPKGHASIDHDYCSECGAKIGTGIGTGDGTGNKPLPKLAVVLDMEICPDCTTRREHKGVIFCEICGYNFTTGARGEVPVEFSPVAAVETPEITPAPAPPPMPGPTRAQWAVLVSIDPLPQPDSPERPVGFAPFTVELSKPVNLVGRTSQTRAIFPEIAIDHDDAVSHRHALLQFDASGGLVVRDIGAANGTLVNGKEIAAMVDHPLSEGDEITLGHWSKLTVTAVAPQAAV